MRLLYKLYKLDNFQLLHISTPHSKSKFYANMKTYALVLDSFSSAIFVGFGKYF